jgi:hypothetical protein
MRARSGTSYRTEAVCNIGPDHMVEASDATSCNVTRQCKPTYKASMCQAENCDGTIVLLAVTNLSSLTTCHPRLFLFLCVVSHLDKSQRALLRVSRVFRAFTLRHDFGRLLGWCCCAQASMGARAKGKAMATICDRELVPSF